MRVVGTLVALALLAVAPPAVAQSTGTLQAFGRIAYSLEPRHVAVVVNEADPDSVAAGEYYRERRGIPAEDLVRVHIEDAPRRLTVGVDGALFGSGHGCDPGRLQPYFDSRSVRPFDDHGMRLAMLLPLQSHEATKALIDRGIAADGSLPRGTAYFVVTPDAQRNTRAKFFPRSQRIASPRLEIVTIRADALRDRPDVMFYLVGEPLAAPYRRMRKS